MKKVVLSLAIASLSVSNGCFGMENNYFYSLDPSAVNPFYQSVVGLESKSSNQNSNNVDNLYLNLNNLAKPDEAVNVKNEHQQEPDQSLNNDDNQNSDVNKQVGNTERNGFWTKTKNLLNKTGIHVGNSLRKHWKSYATGLAITAACCYYVGNKFIYPAGPNSKPTKLNSSHAGLPVPLNGINFLGRSTVKLISFSIKNPVYVFSMTMLSSIAGNLFYKVKSTYGWREAFWTTWDGALIIPRFTKKLVTARDKKKAKNLSSSRSSSGSSSTENIDPETFRKIANLYGVKI